MTSSSRLVNGNLSEVTTYQYPTNLVDGFADLRPSRRLVTRDGVVVSDTAYDYGFAPDGGRLDTVTRSDPVSGVSLVSPRLYYPVSSTNAAEAGRLRLAVSEDRTATLYAYAPTANGGYVRTATHGYIPEPDASAPGADALRFAIAPSQSTRTVETVNFRDDVVRVDEFVHTGDGWSPAGWTTYTFNLAHRRTGFADHKGDWETSDWICTGPVWQDLADGTAVTNTFDKAKRIATSTHYTPFGAVETSYTYNAIGEIVGTTVSTNGVPVRGTLAAYDARGRRILSVDEQCRTNTVSYSADNRTVIRTTRPAPSRLRPSTRMVPCRPSPATSVPTSLAPTASTLRLVFPGPKSAPPRTNLLPPSLPPSPTATPSARPSVTRPPRQTITFAPLSPPTTPSASSSPNRLSIAHRKHLSPLTSHL